ncbi:MAG: ABC transporter substrate-binding protein [Sulfurospirillaceae bacterium]|nr:ABC transporter substrate-binding protein [Sulfurospirillaceae bacterium]
MQKNMDEATSILRDNKLKKDQKAEKLFSIFDSVFDYSLMSKLAVGGRHWETLSPQKQKEFSQVFEQTLKTSYMEKLDLYTDEKLEIVKLEKIKETRIYLTTHLAKNKEVYEIIYKFYKDSNNNWLIYDVDVLGVSIIQTYRTQFADFLAKDTINNLIIKLKNKDS